VSDICFVMAVSPIHFEELIGLTNNNEDLFDFLRKNNVLFDFGSNCAVSSTSPNPTSPNPNLPNTNRVGTLLILFSVTL